MEPRRARAEEALHAQAQKCQRFASESRDIFVRETLIELASDYEHLLARTAKLARLVVRFSKIERIGVAGTWYASAD